MEYLRHKDLTPCDKIFAPVYEETHNWEDSVTSRYNTARFWGIIWLQQTIPCSLSPKCYTSLKTENKETNDLRME